MGIKQAGNGQRLLGIKEDFVGSQWYTTNCSTNASKFVIYAYI
jgi:hypothetical protein